MKNLANSEVLVTFEEKRQIFKPYGVTCERWAPSPMGKFDRHNEIELNFVPNGVLSYFFHNRYVAIPTERLSLFWGLIPHRVIDYSGGDYYFVATIPLVTFLGWKLPEWFVGDVLRGNVMTDSNKDFAIHDIFMFGNWIKDLTSGREDVMLQEAKSRLMRMAAEQTGANAISCSCKEMSKIDEIAIFIAQNYTLPIKAADIGNAVGLHPDYANAIFKKTFGRTMMEHVTMERITHAQRMLILSDNNILQIAYDCGFNSISSFNIAFMKINHCTSREYRKYNSSPNRFPC